MANDNKIYLTREGLTKLQEELKYLEDVRRVEIAEKLKEAISFGDLSENSEYEDARNEQAQVELRIAELTEQLKNYELIEGGEKTSKKANVINIGSVVEIKNTDSGEKEELKIVGSTESDILAATPTISNESPIGSALLGKKQGDVINVKALAGNFKYEILKIK